MWHQHLCLFGILLAILLLVETGLLHQTHLPLWFNSNLPNIHPRFPTISRNRILSIVLRQLAGSLLCLIYWILTYMLAIFPLKLKAKHHWLYEFVSFVTWHILIQPYIVVAFLYSIYSMMMAMHETGVIINDVEYLWDQIFDRIRDRRNSIDDIRIYVARLEQWQRKYHCCGKTGFTDWDGTDPQRIGLRGVWNGSRYVRNPWQNVVVHIPPSCCDPRRTLDCTHEALESREQQLIGQSAESYVDRIPIYRRGCIAPMTETFTMESTEIIFTLFTVDILISAVQLASCFAAYHVQKPKQVQQPAPLLNNANEVDEEEENNVILEDRIDDDNETIDNLEEVEHRIEPPKTFVKFTKQTHGLFHKPYGYVSNERLQAACQSFALGCHPSQFQNVFNATRAEWLERGMQIGWSLKDDLTTYMTFMRPFRLKSSYCPTDVEWSGFRHWLRKRLPLLEAIIYADGNVDREVEGNAIYRCLLIYMLRVAGFLLFGAATARVLIAAFVPKSKESTTKSDQALGQTERRIREDTAAVIDEVAWITQFFMYVTIMIGSVISRRVRCLLFMLLPSLGLTVGMSYLGAELVHTVLVGPASTIERNMRAAANTLECLMELSGNISREAKQFYEESKHNVQLDNAKDYYQSVRAKSEELTGKIEEYKESANKLMQQIKKSEEYAKRAENALKSLSGSTGSEEVDNLDSKRRKRLLNKTQELAAREWNQTKEAMIQSKDALKTILSKLHGHSKQLINMSSALEKGADVEQMIKRRLTATCMVVHNTKAKICGLAAVHACGRLQVIISVAAMFPVIIKPLCVMLVAKDMVCPTSEVVDAAVEQCGNTGSRIGLTPGIGAMFQQAMQSLDGLTEAFHMKIQSIAFRPPAILNWAKKQKSAVTNIARKTKESVQVLFNLSLLFSTALKLLALLVFRKANNYIKGYLTDPEFDNIYAGMSFEAIDNKRLRQKRDTLLPLKKFEKKKVYWRRNAYTKRELAKAALGCIKSVGLGAVLCVFFLIDLYMAEMIGILDVATSQSVNIGKKPNETLGHVKPKTETDEQPLKVEGSGIFKEMIQNTINVLTHVSEMEMNVDLTVCSPRVQQTGEYYWRRFFTIWLCMLIIAALSGYLLRARHMILDFFYPFRQRRRAIYLYNKLLVDRRRHLTICRNLLVHHVREARLQFEAQDYSEAALFHKQRPLLAKLLGRNKATCIVCRDKFKIGPLVRICPFDYCAVCETCKLSVFDGIDLCPVCLDRDPNQLFAKHRKVLERRQQATIEPVC